MNPQKLLRLAAATLVAAVVTALAPALCAQTAGTYSASGLAKLHQGDNDGAIADYTKALELNSSYLGAYIGRGAAMTNQGNFDGAIADFNAAMKLKSTFPDAYLGRGMAEFLQGNLDAAIMDSTKAIELQPDSRAAYYQRALARGAETNFQGATEDFTKALGFKGANDSISDYIALYGSLFGLRTGHVVEEWLKAPTAWSTAWTKELGSFLAKQTSEADLQKFASTKGGEDKAVQVAEAAYFSAVVQLVAGNKAAAKADFQKSLDASGDATVVHRLARVDLDRS